ncbi:MAG: type I glutamate--ammonia ligase [Candidatus Micrarchaeia archaeon]
MVSGREDLLEKIKTDGVEFIDLQVIDLRGKLNHITVPSYSLTDESFSEGLPKLDGSSLRGFKEIYESDMVLMPDPSTYAVLPWAKDPAYKTARLMAFVLEDNGRRSFSRDPRYIAANAESYLKEHGYSTSYWGPELEFFIFDKARWNTNLRYRETSSYYKIYSSEIENPVNYSFRPKEGYYPTEPHDSLSMLRGEMSIIAKKSFGIEVEAHHHEVASGGQSEIDIKYNTLLKQADNLATLKYVVKNVAANNGKVVTFMPKPLFGDNGSGLHVHTSFWNGSKNEFYDENDSYAELSQTGRYFVGGLKEHSRSLTAIVAPTTNSYKRLVPGFEAPIFIAWSKGNRSANIRIPVYFKSKPTAKRVEFRTPDPSCNHYFAFAAMLLAGLDGIKKKIDPGDPVDENIYKLSLERRKELGVEELPRNLFEATESLRSDNEYLKPLFESELIEWFIKSESSDHIAVEGRPTPHEFYLYFDL